MTAQLAAVPSLSGDLSEVPAFVGAAPLAHAKPAANRFAPLTPATNHTRHARIMIVDDELINIKVVRKYLSTAGYENFIQCRDPREFMTKARLEKPDAVLLDVMMPHISGLDLLIHIRADAELAHLPVIIVTASDDDETRLTALQRGATDFLGKPVNVTELLPRVRNALVVKAHHDQLALYAHELERQVRLRTAELAVSRQELIHCLARAAEYRDNETGQHVIRVGRYTGVLARQLGLDDVRVGLLEHAAPLHDIGKIGIPDAILLEPTKLSPDEFEIMQRHTTFGSRTFEPMSVDEWRNFRTHTVLGQKIMEISTSPIMEMAGRIALSHHERWDGTGYPNGLRGEEIPIEGRIVAVADVFDALSSRRPYKPPMPLDDCLRIIREGRGSHFDPAVIDAFFARQAEIVEIREALADAG